MAEWFQTHNMLTVHPKVLDGTPGCATDPAFIKAYGFYKPLDQYTARTWV